MAYASGEDLIARYDIDLVGDMASDERETLDRSEVPGHPHVVVALQDASGEVDVALLAGGRYSPQQLAELSGGSRSHLIAIVCGLAMAALHDRRPEAVESETIERLTKKSRDAIHALRRGENVFGIVEHIEAGQLEVSGPSAIDLRKRNALPERMSRYFPQPQSRLPLHR